MDWRRSNDRLMLPMRGREIDATRCTVCGALLSCGRFTEAFPRPLVCTKGKFGRDGRWDTSACFGIELNVDLPILEASVGRLPATDLRRVMRERILR